MGATGFKCKLMLLTFRIWQCCLSVCKLARGLRLDLTAMIKHDHKSDHGKKTWTYLKSQVGFRPKDDMSILSCD
ncbi:hypothetical protein F5Y15DRAFT_393023 [Xylariaceae sp. FL0016]|nr:hypothetical protein F5Y15DRAFT_393023 [Xylariaceae sp. FL0016]